jgi:hypothetical protein
MSTTVILEPTARTGSAALIPWHALDTLAGKVVGFIDNSKPNFHHLADDAMADIESQCDLVITGSGD